MRRKQARAIESRLAKVERLVDRIDRNVERIELVTLVREPDTSLSADAYDGLRKQVIAATGARNAHLHQLVEFDAALRAGATAAELRALVAQWLGQASVQVVDDAVAAEQAFEFVGDAAGNERLVDPAYVDGQTGRLIKTGLVERVAPAADGGAPPAEATPDAEASTAPVEPAADAPAEPEEVGR